MDIPPKKKPRGTKEKNEIKKHKIEQTYNQNTLKDYLSMNFAALANQRLYNPVKPIKKATRQLLKDLVKDPTQIFRDSLCQSYIVGSHSIGTSEIEPTQRFIELKNAILDLLVQEEISPTENPSLISELLHFSTKQWLSPQEKQIFQDKINDQEWLECCDNPKKGIKTIYSIERKRTLFRPFRGIPKKIIVYRESVKPMENLKNGEEKIIYIYSRLEYDLETHEVQLEFSYSIDGQTFYVDSELVDQTFPEADM